MNIFTGKPLDYVIELDESVEWFAIPGHITEPGWMPDERPEGLFIFYGNIRDQIKKNSFGPYLARGDHDDIFRDYGERIPDPDAPGGFDNGFWRYIDMQIAAAVRLHADAIEWDNLDSLDVAVALMIFDRSAAAGLKVAVKNPMIVTRDGGERARLLQHEAAVIVIIETGAGDVLWNDALRIRAGRPTMPLRFIAYADELDEAEVRAAEAPNYVDVGVSYSKTGEYGSSRQLALPKTDTVNDMADDWRLAKSLEVLRSQVNELRPSRSKSTDGTIGDEAHRARQSDHNPDKDGVVTAIDITHDPRNGVDTYAMAESMRIARPIDKRIEYVISNHRIWTPSISSEWRTYTGTNPHTEHVHISVHDNKSIYDITDPWVFTLPPPDTSVAPQYPLLVLGSTGLDVERAQKLLLTAGYDVGASGVDGIFGTDTKAATMAFQAATPGLAVDGDVGPYTWKALLAAIPRPVVVGTLPVTAVDKIMQLAAASPLRSFVWGNRGVMPIGCLKGLAVVYGQVYRDLLAQGSAAMVMARAIGSPSKDALAWCEPELRAAGIIPVNAIDRLRATWTVMYGLVMRESSGIYWEGRDTQADNTNGSDTEAGLFQQSYNSAAASAEIQRLMTDYTIGGAMGYLTIFKEGVPAGSSENFGSGQAKLFQELCKSKPAFACEAAAVILRVLGGGPVPLGHFGPVSRHEVIINPDATKLLLQVQTVIDAIGGIDGEIIDPGEPGGPLPIIDPDELLLVLVLLLLLKESDMANTPANRPDLAPIIAALLARLGGGTAAPPPPSPPPAVVTNDPTAELLRLLAAKYGIVLPSAAQQPSPTPAPTPTPAPEPTPGSKPVTDRTGVQLSLWAVVGAAVLQYFGIVGTPFGAGVQPTDVGTATTLATGASLLVSMFGGWDNIFDFAKRFGAAFASARKPQTPPQ